MYLCSESNSQGDAAINTSIKGGKYLLMLMMKITQKKELMYRNCNKAEMVIESNIFQATQEQRCFDLLKQ